MKKIALEGPINKCADADCVDWRQRTIAELGDKFTFHNPMDFDCRGREEELRDALVKFDEAGMAASDIFLVYTPAPSYGTAMAMQYGHALHRHIVTVCPADKPSPWLVSRSSVVFKTLSEAIEHIKSIA